MVAGSNSLNIKDYPFAFSMVALFFPELVTTNSINNDAIPIVLGIMLFGGIFGSILTIANPFGRLVKLIYHFSIKDSFLSEINRNKFTTTLIKKNHASSLSSPSISFEIDKIIGIFYFTVLIGIMFLRILTDENFRTIIKLDSTNLIYGQSLIGAIFFGMLFILIISINGISVSKLKSFSLLNKIKSVSVLFIAKDILNISIKTKIVYTTCYRHPNYHNTIMMFVTQMSALMLTGDQLQKRDSELKAISDKYLLGLNSGNFHSDFFEWQKIVIELQNTYHTDLSDIITWLNTPPAFILPDEFDSPISQLQSSVDTRDWYDADLTAYRIKDRINRLYLEKGWSPAYEIPNNFFTKQ